MTKRTSAIVLLAIVITITLAVTRHHPTHSEPCTVDACIELDVNNKSVARFNDFYLVPNHCIAYKEAMWKQYCGTWELKWIGPNNTSQKV